MGTKIVAEASVKYNVEKFVLISTDKAVNPTNVMGASKRIAEIFCQNLNEYSDTSFITVRFGNVLGSAGSVIPLFRRQLAQGGPLTVTHKDITRYFMTIPEACQLILQASILGTGGEIFVLDMGEPIKINYLAEQLISLSGKIPGVDIQIEYTGLRPGEKLYEELFHDAEQLQQTIHRKIFKAMSRTVDGAQLHEKLSQLQKEYELRHLSEAMNIIQELVPEGHFNR
jgi:FlaA1/EpsC-like NDP-sugar epimerase